MRALQLIVLTWGINLISMDLSAQTTATTLHARAVSAFEVVSIHSMKSEDHPPEHIDNPSRRGYLKAVNVNLKSLMEIAYDIPDLRMFGGPEWVTSERFSLEAKSDVSVNDQLAGLPNDQAKQAKRKMIAALLESRFNLAVHEERKEMPVYTLVVAKSGSKRASSKDGNDSQPAGGEILEIHAGSNSLQTLAYELSWRVGRPVLDRTGLQEKDAFTLRWRNDEEPQADSNSPSLFTALQEQLGLKLESTRAPVPVLLIDHVEKPTD